ncbi:UNVERIFIED_CONTAM: hypothetical protein GTU68_040626 [Idotea baltica]|nr:hypothetical protein [Idotea baltica]
MEVFVCVKASQIGHVFVFDRDADFATPLLTQLTYEGALDEHFGIRAGVVEFPPEVTGAAEGAEGAHPAKVALNSRDTVFESIRNRHFAGVANHLLRKARELQERRSTTASMTPAQMKSFVSKDLRGLQAIQRSLSLHISACEGITKGTRRDFEDQLVTEHGLVTGGVGVGEAKAYIEDCMARQLPSRVPLRLLCLLSITQQGLSRKDYEPLATQFFSAYGHHHLLTLFRLRRMGLLLLLGGDSPDEGGKPLLKQVASSLGVSRKAGHWAALVSKLSLIPAAEDHIDLHNPSHMSYVFNGAFTPLIPQLVSEALTKGFGSLSEALKMVPGTSFASIRPEGANTPLPRVALVLILGGVTYAEVAALRLLADTLGTKIIVASTCTTTGTSLVRAATQP